MSAWPAYLGLVEAGRLLERAERARERLRACRLCPRECGVDRLRGERGYCAAGALARVATAGPHFGEESVLVGSGGSGTIFFSHCSLGCVFCQNYDISREGRGQDMTATRLAETMLRLQRMGCHNVNLVTPTHFVPQILEAVAIAAQQGLALPLVYNCGGYETTATLALLDGVVDIYMPDAKFARRESAERYANAPDYPDRCAAALKEMHRQVGDLVVGSDGLARRGLLVRHLVMPEGVDEATEVMQLLAGISTATRVNVMGQYRPCYRASDWPEIARPTTRAECAAATRAARALGLVCLSPDYS